MKQLGYLFLGLVFLGVGTAALVGLAGYVGLWVCYVGSVVDFINQCKAPTTDAWTIAWDLFGFFIGGSFCVCVGIWIGVLMTANGFGCLSAGLKPRRKP